MKKVLLLIGLFLFLSGNIIAQNSTFGISGKVVDGDTREPLEQVTVQLLSLPDSSFVTGDISQPNGRFRLSAPKAGNYIVKLSFVGYQTLEEEVSLTTSKPNIGLGEIILPSDAILLGEAVVIAEAPPVTMKEDTIIYAASAYRVAEGAMLEELVKKLPGAEVDSEGKITINGKEIKKIMVDGKEFFSDDPKVSMKNLPVEILDNVKAYERKSDMARITGIDDGEEETVLDLTVKKGMKRGWIGNLIAGYGTEDRYEGGGMISRFMDDSSISIIGSVNNTNNTGFSEFGDAGKGMSNSRGGAGSGITSSRSIGLNYARDTKKLQYGGNVQYGYTDNDAWSRKGTENLLGEEGSSYNLSENTSGRQRHDVRADFRFEWKIDSLTTLIFRPNASYSKTNSESRGESWEENNERNRVNEKLSTSSGKNDNYSISSRVELFRKFNKKGRNLSFRANLGYSDGSGNTNSFSDMLFYNYDEYGEYIGDSISIIDRTTDRTNTNLNYTLSTSYTEPIFKNHFLQVRYSFTFRNSSAQSLVYDNLEPGDYVNDLSNKVENFYYNHAAEVSLRGIQPKMMYNVGMSFNPQSSRSETTIGPNSNNPGKRQNVLNYAPSVMFRYMFTKQHMLMLRYRGQSSEPSIDDLQEVIDISDPLNLRYGNPDLKPSFRNTVMLFYNNYMPETMRSYSLNLFFNNTINDITNRIIYNTETGGQIAERVNVNGNWNARGYFSFNTPFRNRKYTLSSNTNTSFSNTASYREVNRSKVYQLTNTKSLNLTERLTGSYRSEWFDLSLNASVTYGLVRNKQQSDSDRETFDYLFGGSTNINLPWQLYLSTDVNYRIKEGYGGDFDQDEILWNAQISKSFLKNNKATIRFKIYDILRQQTNLSRTITDNKIVDTEYNTLGSYCMFHFVYRLNTLGGKAARSSNNRDRMRMGDGPGGRREGGFGPPPGSGGGFR